MIDRSIPWSNKSVIFWEWFMCTQQLELFFGGDMGGLGSPCRMVWNGSTEADLGIFHAHSKPFWFDPVTLWDLPLAALQPEGLKMRSYFEIFHAHSQNLFDLTPLDLETGTPNHSQRMGSKILFLKNFMPGFFLNFSDMTPLEEMWGLPKKGS